MNIFRGCRTFEEAERRARAWLEQIHFDLRRNNETRMLVTRDEAGELLDVDAIDESLRAQDACRADAIDRGVAEMMAQLRSLVTRPEGQG